MASLSVCTVGCNDFFDKIPGVQYDLESTFTSRVKTEQYLNNVYSYVRDITRESNPDQMGGMFTAGSLESGITFMDKPSWDWNLGTTYASSGWTKMWFVDYYRAIAKASTFIQQVDKCLEATLIERARWKAEARALRALFYFELFRIYGPIPIIGEEAMPTDANLSELLRERNSVDECVAYIADEFDKAADAELLAQQKGSGLGRMDKAACKAFKAKLLLYAASDLYNGNADYASIKNADGKQLFPLQYDASKWEKARLAYEDFFNHYGNMYKLQEVFTANNKLDHYESCRVASSGFKPESNQEVIFLKLVSHYTYRYVTTPKHAGINQGEIQGGIGLFATQEMVDMFFTDKGLRIDDDLNYPQYAGVPAANLYGAKSDYVVNGRQYFKQGAEVLNQWMNREPRFYVNITFNGATWLNTGTNAGLVTTEFNYSGNSGRQKNEHDSPNTGYSVRKGASASGETNDNHYSNILRLADMYLGYAETLSEGNNPDYSKALEYVNKIRYRAGVPEYGSGQDNNGFTRIAVPLTKQEVRNRIRRERLVELAFEWNHFFDVRRWKVADKDGDGWVYPSYHRGGEGGAMHGLNMAKNVPQFFEKVVVENRVFQKKHYFMPIPHEDILRNPKLVQNLDWNVQVAK